jgi:hypothetical protein
MSEFSVRARLEDKGVAVDEFDVGMQEAFQLQIASLAQSAMAEWVRLAQENLKTSRDIYIQGLRQAESFKASESAMGMKFEISLVGEMPNNFEFGMGSFDMKTVRPGWLGGMRAKIGKDGKKYVTIPMRHSTGSGARMGYTGKAAAIEGPNLKTQLRRAVKQYGLDKMVMTATGQVAEGTVARIPKGAPVHPYLKGMVRTQKALDVPKWRGSGQLTTFRRLSENSKPSAWIHPGLKAANLLPEVESWLDSQLDRVIEMILGV